MVPVDFVSKRTMIKITFENCKTLWGYTLDFFRTALLCARLPLTDQPVAQMPYTSLFLCNHWPISCRVNMEPSFAGSRRMILAHRDLVSILHLQKPFFESAGGTMHPAFIQKCVPPHSLYPSYPFLFLFSIFARDSSKTQAFHLVEWRKGMPVLWKDSFSSTTLEHTHTHTLTKRNRCVCTQEHCTVAKLY